MAEEDDVSKTEDPTAKKLNDARRKGSVAQSQEVKNWAILFGAAGLLIFLAPYMATNLRNTTRPFIEMPHAIDLKFGDIREVFIDLTLESFIILAPLMVVMVVSR